MKRTKKILIVRILSIGILLFIIVSLHACDVTVECSRFAAQRRQAGQKEQEWETELQCIIPQTEFKAYYAYEGERDGKILGVRVDPGIDEDFPLNYYYSASFLFSNFYNREVIVWYLDNDKNRSKWLKSEPIAPHDTVVIEGGPYHNSYKYCPDLGEDSSFRRGISHILVIDSDESCASIDPKNEDVKNFLIAISDPKYDLFAD